MNTLNNKPSIPSDEALQAKNAEKLEKALAYLGEKHILKQNVVKKFAVPLKH